MATQKKGSFTSRIIVGEDSTTEHSCEVGFDCHPTRTTGMFTNGPDTLWTDRIVECKLSYDGMTTTVKVNFDSDEERDKIMSSKEEAKRILEPMISKACDSPKIRFV